METVSTVFEEVCDGVSSNEALRADLEAGRFDLGWATYQLMVANEIADAQTHHVGGRLALARGDLHSTRTAMQQALAAGAAGEILGQVRLVLGEVHRRIGELGEAIDQLRAFVDGIDEYPGLRAVWLGCGLYNLGLAYRQRGRIDDARATYRLAIAEFRREGLTDLMGQALWNLAWADCLAGDTTTARGCLGESEAVRGDEVARWHQRLGWAFVEALEGRAQATAEFCRAALADGSTAPVDVRAHAAILLGREALRRGDLAVALGCACQAATLGATDPGDNRALQDANALRVAVLERMNTTATA